MNKEMNNQNHNQNHNQNTIPKKYNISEAICSRSGLKFRWVEENIKGLDYSLFLHVHPLFLGENFLRVENALLGNSSTHATQSTQLDTTVAAALILFRLNSWKVLQPKPREKELNAWCEYLGKEMSLHQLKKCYQLCVANFGNKHGEVKLEEKFKFNLSAIASNTDSLNSNPNPYVKQFLNLISKCENARIAEVRLQIELEKEQRILDENYNEIIGINKVNEENNIQSRQIDNIDKEFLTKKAILAITAIYRTIEWEKVTKKDKEKEKKFKAQLKKAQEEIKANRLEFLDSDLQERILKYIEWSMQISGVKGKPGKYLKMYIAWIRSQETVGWCEEMEEMGEMGEEENEEEIRVMKTIRTMGAIA